MRTNCISLSWIIAEKEERVLRRVGFVTVAIMILLPMAAWASPGGNSNKPEKENLEDRIPFVVDADGQKIGTVARVGPSGAKVQVEIDGIITSLTVTETAILTEVCDFGIYFESNDCSGIALIQTSQVAPALGGFAGRSWRCQVPVIGDTLYIQVPGPAINTTANSFINLTLATPTCQAVFSPNDYITTVDYSGTMR